MPRLPTGRYVEITSDRARYHAARTGMRVKANTPRAHLYPLVDILVEHPRSNPLSRHLGFSGHTLADARWLRRWDTRDREAFCAWIREAAQVRVIEYARRRLLAEDGSPRERVFDYPAHLYSALRERVARLNLPRAKPQQWRRTLLNLVKDGVRREELEWSGILGVLDDLPAGKLIDKTFVTGALDFTSVRPRLTQELVCGQGCLLPFKEVAQKLQGYQLQLAGLEAADADIGVIRFASAAPAYKVGVLWPGGRAPGPGMDGRWFALGPYGEAVADGAAKSRKVFATQAQASDAAQAHALRNARARCDLVESARYDHMTLHGGTQYREWLVSLPEYAHTHFSGHYPERNILAHVRTKVRETQAGERVLFIEELQSDWHQALAKSGVRGMIPRAPYKNDWAALALKLMLMHAVAENLDGIAWTDGRVHELRYDRPLPPLRRLYDRTMVEALNALTKPWGGEVGRGAFVTRSPWLRAVRNKDVWRVEGGSGKFATRARYTKAEAMRLIERHSKAVCLDLPMVRFNDDIRDRITTYGLPLFGTKWLLPEEG